VLLCGVGTSRALGWASNAPKPERTAQPWVKLPLEALGVAGIPAAFLDAGGSMLTVNFLDSGHLLVTYGKRGLVPRLAGDPRDDDDRLVAAEVVELPTGKVLATTEWHMHDHGRYLWALGHGRFLVRIGDMLSVMTPLARLGTDDPFVRSTFPSRGGQPVAVTMSQDDGLLTVETPVRMAGGTSEAMGDMDTATRPLSTLIDFYRLRGDGSEAHPLEIAGAGTVRSPQPLFLPIDADGYLWAEELDRNQWQVTFDGFEGKTVQLGKIDSTCSPRLELVGPAEYLAMTCRGADDRVRVASYGMDGQETWEESLGQFGRPVFAYAPSAGRFAVSHGVDAVPAAPGNGVGSPASYGVGGSQGSPARQEVRVYQTVSGDLLLKVDCTPVFKTAENFDLSADGMEAVVVRDNALVVYKLPELSKKDREELAAVEKFAPPASEGPVKLTRLTGPQPQRGDAVSAAAVEAAAAAAAAAPAVATEKPPARKPPTLLNPGEKAEMPANNRPD